MVKIISHRARLDTDVYELKDNSLEAIYTILANTNFDIEVDVRLSNEGNLYLGHDFFNEFFPDNDVSQLVYNDRMLFHCKTLRTFERIKFLKNQRFLQQKFISDSFIHDVDIGTISEKGNLIVHPSLVSNNQWGEIPDGSYLVLPHMRPVPFLVSQYISVEKLKKMEAVITDFPFEMDRLLNG